MHERAHEPHAGERTHIQTRTYTRRQMSVYAWDGMNEQTIKSAGRDTYALVYLFVCRLNCT